MLRYRQWVLSFDGPTAIRLGYNTALLGLVCRTFSRAVLRHLRRISKARRRASSKLEAGLVLVVQRRGAAWARAHLSVLSQRLKRLVEAGC